MGFLSAKIMKLKERINPTATCISQEKATDYLNSGDNPVISVVRDLLDQVKEHDILFTKLWILKFLTDLIRPIVDLPWNFTENNIYIRQQFVLASLYSIIGNQKESQKCYMKGVEEFDKLSVELFHMEGAGYLDYIKSTYDLCERFMNSEFLETAAVIEFRQRFKDSLYQVSKLRFPNGDIPTTDTRKTSGLATLITPYLNNDLFTSCRLNADSAYLITHNTHITKFKHNDHITWDFGHIVFMKGGKYILKHPFYTGYPDKMKNKEYKPEFKNVICGKFNRERWWRIKKNPAELKVSRVDNRLVLNIGNEATRIIRILKDRMIVKDIGGDYSTFNVLKDSKDVIFWSKQIKKEDIGDGYERITLFGSERITEINIESKI